MTIYYTIYKTTNKVNGKIYIGQHKTTNPYDDYIGSGSDISAAKKEFGRENFTKEILFIFDNEKDMDDKEKELVTEEFVLCDDNYNIIPGGRDAFTMIDKKHSEETKQKMRGKKRSEEAKQRMSAARKGKKHSDETKQKMSKSSKGKPKSEEHKQNLSTALTGKKQSEEHINKVAESNRGKKRSDEAKQKISAANKGKKRSEETKQKIRCKKHSEEVKQRMSISRTGTIWITDGVTNTRIPKCSDIPDGFWKGITKK